MARKRYIDKVAEFNKMVRYFPANLTAKFLLHLEESPISPSLTKGRGEAAGSEVLTPSRATGHMRCGCVAD